MMGRKGRGVGAPGWVLGDGSRPGSDPGSRWGTCGIDLDSLDIMVSSTDPLGSGASSHTMLGGWGKKKVEIETS